MLFMTMERKQEISITHDDIDTVVQNLIEDCGFDPENLPTTNDIIIEIIKAGSLTEMGDDDAEEWRSEMDDEQDELLMDEFWKSFERQVVGMIQDAIKERKRRMR